MAGKRLSIPIQTVYIMSLLAIDAAWFYVKAPRSRFKYLVLFHNYPAYLSSSHTRQTYRQRGFKTCPEALVK